MLQDVRNGHSTEIDAINGSISSIGERLNIPTPENDKLIAQIKQIENNYPREIV
jgi:2-dehydropantoate 2-reductase